MLVPGKRQADFYVGFLYEVLADDPCGCQSVKSLSRDRETLVSRSSGEGIGFITKTLPKLGKALDKGLVDARFSMPDGFKPAAHRNTPAFLQAYFNRVFNADGVLLDDADPAAVSHIRQVCFAGYKLEFPYSADQESRVIGSFVSTEQELQTMDFDEPSDELVGASYLIRDVFSDFDHKDIIPRHGPGAVATGERLDEKWEFARLYRSIHQVYPYYDYFTVGGSRELIDRLGWYKSLERRETGTAKVVLVPKDSRGPRLISCEPLEYQWIQQGLGRKLMAHIESSSRTRGVVNFTNQEVNRMLALTSSRTQEFATLDLKDASDRVSLALVRQLFKHNEGLLRALLATRTTATKLPDGSVVPLSKFAPMGSALCFPIEAICFWAILVAAISRSTSAMPFEVGREVFVFGDDIIVRTEHADLCVAALERYGLRVNRDKSCSSGHFRESCGCDAFKGIDVTPVKLRKLWSGKATDASAYAAYVAYGNDLYRRGYKCAGDYVFAELKRVYGPVPYGVADSPMPCRVVENPLDAERLNAAEFPTRFNEDYQLFQFKVNLIKTRKVDRTLDGWQRLMLNQTMVSTETDPSVVVIPRSTRIKRGWTRV